MTIDTPDLDDVEVTPAARTAALAAETARAIHAKRVEHAAQLVDTLRNFNRFLEANPEQAFNASAIRTLLAQSDGLLAGARALARGSR